MLFNKMTDWQRLIYKQIELLEYYSVFENY